MACRNWPRRRLVVGRAIAIRVVQKRSRSDVARQRTGCSKAGRLTEDPAPARRRAGKPGADLRALIPPAPIRRHRFFRPAEAGASSGPPCGQRKHRANPRPACARCEIPRDSVVIWQALIGSPSFLRSETLIFRSPSSVFLRKPNDLAFPLLRSHPSWPASHPTSRSAVERNPGACSISSVLIPAR